MTRKRSVSPTPPPAASVLDPIVVPPGPVVLIELDPGVSGGTVHNRFDIMLRGRAMSEVGIEEIRLEAGGQVVSVASFGQPERAALGVMPDGRPARQRSFHFNLPRPAARESGSDDIQIVARTQDGDELVQPFVLAVDPDGTEPVSVVSGPTRNGVAGGAVRPYAILYIERATLDGDGLLVVQGWAVCLGPILAVQILASHHRIAAARLSGPRDDVAAVFPAYPNARLSGFSLSIQIETNTPSVETICAKLVCPHGFGHEETVPIERLARHAAAPPPMPPGAVVAPVPGYSLLNKQPSYRLKADFQMQEAPLMALMPSAAPAAPAAIIDPASGIRMFCDAARLSGDGILHVKGWAVSAAGIAQIRVLVDDADVALAAFGHERADVGRLHPDIPKGHLSGFKLDTKIAGRFEGEHSILVVARNRNGEEKEHRLVVLAGRVALASPARPPALQEAAPETPANEVAEFRFELDQPALSNGAVAEPVTGRLTIQGWLLSRSGVTGFEVFLDDQRLGDAHYGLARQDVGNAFPEWPNALRSGFAFHCPPRSLRNGDHTVRLEIKSAGGQDMIRSFKVTVNKSDNQQDQAGIRRRVPRVETDMMSAFLAGLRYQPRFHFILRQGRNLAVDLLRKTFESLRLQMYGAWTMTILAEDDDVAAAMQVILDDSVPHLADRFTLLTPSQAAAWASPLARAEDAGDVLHGFLLPGDEMGADALYELAVAAGRHPDVGMIYGDEVRLSPVTAEKEAFFKPDFSPDLLYSTNYIGRPWVVTSRTLAQVAASAASLSANGEYDLVLRCAEAAQGALHVPKLLCQRGGTVLDDVAMERAALRAMQARQGIAGEILVTDILGTWRLRRALGSVGMVSIIIPTCAANGYIGTCIKTLREKTSYKNYEIIVIDNIPDQDMSWKIWVTQNADKVVDIPADFNWSIFNNRAAEMAAGEYLLFLNDDITITQPDWLQALLEHAQRPDIGIVGPQLLYPDGKVQHAGMFLSSNGIGRHAFRFAAHDDPGYFGLALTQRNVIAVTGACMLVRKAVFDRLGGFDEAHQIVNNDLDFCLRVHRAGLLTVFTPYATMIHHELASRARLKDVFDLTQFNAAWKTVFAAGDPYFNPRLSGHDDDYRPDDEPVQWVVSGAPLFHVAEIRSILVVKLDHIGDFVTALAPIRRLKTLFPEASITVLAGPASRAFVTLEPSIDAFIPFAFFHARSQLGERELTQQDYATLGEQLRPYRFDLAIDLRKHPSTRDVLKFAGARFLAGFDHLGQYPDLDVALDWDGDRTLQRKRSHIVVDLLALVNAVGHATETDRVIMNPGPSAMPLQDMPDDVRALFVKPVVAIHPGAGNITKQWPEAHFSALIDLLVERNGVNIMLIGGPDETDIADRLMASVLHPEAVASMAGRASLADLPRLLKTCALYIGNDSGPKHIAAAIGMPTIGVHSGVVDPVEWGPIGPKAVALRRNMTCSPCYLANAEDCPRALACLQYLEPSLVYETADLMLMRPAAADAPVVRKSRPRQQRRIAEPV